MVPKIKTCDLVERNSKFLFVVYICMVVAVTLFPLPIGFPSNIENLNRSVNIIPFASIIKDINQIGSAYDGDALFMIGLIVRNVGGIFYY